MILITDTVSFRAIARLAADTKAAELYIICIDNPKERYRVSSYHEDGMGFLLESCSFTDKFMLYNARLLDGNLIIEGGQDGDKPKSARPVVNFRVNIFYK